MAGRGKSEGEKHRDIYATVGELVLIASMLDHMLVTVLVDVLDLGDATLLPSVLTTLDPARKLEILKSYAKHIRQSDWKRGISRLVDKAEYVFKHRNYACHMQAALRDNTWTLEPYAAAKFLKNFNTADKTLKTISIEDIRLAIKCAEEALGMVRNLSQNFRRVGQELKRRNALKKQAPQ